MRPSKDRLGLMLLASLRLLSNCVKLFLFVHSILEVGVGVGPHGVCSMVASFSKLSCGELDVVGRWPHGSVAMVTMHVPWELTSLGN